MHNTSTVLSRLLFLPQYVTNVFSLTWILTLDKYCAYVSEGAVGVVVSMLALLLDNHQQRTYNCILVHNLNLLAMDSWILLTFTTGTTVPGISHSSSRYSHHCKLIITVISNA